MGEELAMKPHHFIDILGSYGAGAREFKPHAYGHAVHSVSERLMRERNAMLRMELGIDAICEPCVHNVNGTCDDTIDTSFRPSAPSLKTEWNLMIDRRWCERLGLKQDDRIRADDFCRLARERMGDISDIYREAPADHVAARVERLNAGLDWFLSQPSDA